MDAHKGAALRVLSIVAPPFSAAGTITLDETARYRRRIKMVSDNGIPFLLDLPKARLLKHGDGLHLEDGRIVEVRAVPEPLFEVRGRDSVHFARLIWHLGNRHLATEISADSVRIRRDHVIRDMLEHLGASVVEIEAPFDPEAGAYGDHHHDHASGHDHQAHSGHGNDSKHT
ncbi:MAG: urease accessory protein UreE [Pseudomonadota bacterium]